MVLRWCFFPEFNDILFISYIFCPSFLFPPLKVTFLKYSSFEVISFSYFLSFFLPRSFKDFILFLSFRSNIFVLSFLPRLLIFLSSSRLFMGVRQDFSFSIIYDFVLFIFSIFYVLNVFCFFELIEFRFFSFAFILSLDYLFLCSSLFFDDFN